MGTCREERGRGGLREMCQQHIPPLKMAGGGGQDSLLEAHSLEQRPGSDYSDRELLTDVAVPDLFQSSTIALIDHFHTAVTTKTKV